jgi:hypothetical protein
MRCHLSRGGVVTEPGSVTALSPTQCVGSRFRPLAVAYLRLWPCDSPEHADAVTARLRRFADAHGLALADVYTEQPDTPASREGAAFSALMAALRRPHITTVIVPAEHFARLHGMYRAMCTAIAVETCADLLIVAGGTR